MDGDWLEAKMDALQAIFERGEMTPEEYRRRAGEIIRDADREAARRDIIAAGRGHQVR